MGSIDYIRADNTMHGHEYSDLDVRVPRSRSKKYLVQDSLDTDQLLKVTRSQYPSIDTLPETALFNQNLKKQVDYDLECARDPNCTNRQKIGDINNTWYADRDYMAARKRTLETEKTIRGVKKTLIALIIIVAIVILTRYLIQNKIWEKAFIKTQNPVNTAGANNKPAGANDKCGEKFSIKEAAYDTMRHDYLRPTQRHVDEINRRAKNAMVYSSYYDPQTNMQTHGNQPQSYMDIAQRNVMKPLEFDQMMNYYNRFNPNGMALVNGVGGTQSEIRDTVASSNGGALQGITLEDVTITDPEQLHMLDMQTQQYEPQDQPHMRYERLNQVRNLKMKEQALKRQRERQDPRSRAALLARDFANSDPQFIKQKQLADERLMDKFRKGQMVDALGVMDYADLEQMYD